MEEDKVKKYLNSINRMIKSGNVKYISYITREYMKYQKVSPVISEAIGNMIFTEANKSTNSPYEMLIHKNGQICLEAMSDISKITNLSQFISTVQELSDKNIDFSDVEADDLIQEGDELIEELEQELEKEEITQEDAEKTEAKAESAIAKIGILAAIGGTIGAAAVAMLAKLKQKVASFNKNKDTKLEEQNIQNDTKNQKSNTPLSNQTTAKAQETKTQAKSNDIFQKYEIDYDKVYEEMDNNKKEKQAQIAKRKNTDTYGDGDPDGDDLDI